MITSFTDEKVPLTVTSQHRLSKLSLLCDVIGPRLMLVLYMRAIPPPVPFGRGT